MEGTFKEKVPKVSRYASLFSRFVFHSYPFCILFASFSFSFSFSFDFASVLDLFLAPMFLLDLLLLA
jgi:hypothetical protein